LITLDVPLDFVQTKMSVRMEKNKKKSNAGRKPIVYLLEDLERANMIYLVAGETGVGKTHRNLLEIKRYMQDDLNTIFKKGEGTRTKSGRKVLVFDTNDDDYPYRTVSPDHIKALTLVAARRIRPFNRDGSPMNEEQKKEVVEKILKFYQNGMVVLDDIDHYATGGKGQSMIGALCTIRHKGIDLLLTHQSIAKISTTEWQNCTWLRLHHQVDDVTRYRERIPKYSLVRIAQFIVDEQYELAHATNATGKISEGEFRKRKSFFVYVDMRRQKILGCSKEAFIRACKKFIDQEESRKISMMLLERDWNNKAVYGSRNEVVIKLITEKLRFHEKKVIYPLEEGLEKGV
jgi:hypothetical protein